MERALVAGAGGLIGCQLVTRLKKEGYRVPGAGIKLPEIVGARNLLDPAAARRDGFRYTRIGRP